MNVEEKESQYAQTRRTWAEIDLDALGHNFREIQSRLQPGVKICCVIKADGYGHGAVALAREYESLGADWFAVSNIEEAEELRRAGIRRPILILGYTPPACAGKLAAYGISQAVLGLEYARQLSREATAQGVSVKVHIKVDTGMSRIGFFYQDPQRDGKALEEMKEACRLPGLSPEGIFTHFAVADEGGNGEEFTRRQFANFTGAIRYLEERGISFSIRHCANSAAIGEYPEFQLDMVRPGIIQYGLLPSYVLRAPMALRPVMTLKSVLSLVKKVEPGTAVSYGCTFRAESPSVIGTIPVGYADGYRRTLSGRACVLVRGKRAPILGRVCMDQMMVDLTDIPEAKAGEEVILFGEGLPVDELARLENTINYELVCDVNRRVPRVYVRGAQVIGELHYLEQTTGAQ